MRERELLGQIVDLSVKQFGIGRTSYAKCLFCEDTADCLPKVKHKHGCPIARAADLLSHEVEVEEGRYEQVLARLKRLEGVVQP